MLIECTIVFCGIFFMYKIVIIFFFISPFVSASSNLKEFSKDIYFGGKVGLTLYDNS